MRPTLGPDGVPPPEKLGPHLLVKLKRGWRYDDARAVFVSPDEQDFAPGATLPRGGRVAYVIPDLAQAVPRSLPEYERDLARCMHVILPKGSNASDYVDAVKGWPCVEDVQRPPEISLPGHHPSSQEP